jgi:hypothetical protein
MRRSHRGFERCLATLFVAVAVLAASAAPAHAEAEGALAAEQFGRKVFDAIVLRPLGFVQTVVSAGFFLVAYPVSLVTGGSDHVIEVCIEQPVAQTFRKPLGEL